MALAMRSDRDLGLSMPERLRAFALELHRLAYTLPTGQENEFLELEQRMLMRAVEIEDASARSQAMRA